MSNGGGVGEDGGIVGDAASSGVTPCDAGVCGSVVGYVQRTSTAPAHGGKGSVYVAIFDGDPITDQAGATVVARQLLPDEDMTAATAQVAYRIDGVPVSSQGYQVIAFLDDADQVTASNPEPAAGDLVSIATTSTGFGGVPLSITGSGVVTLDLPLNVAMP